MDVIVLIGRILFSMVFVGAGIGHLTQTEGTAAAAEARGLPSPRLMAQISGVVMLLGGLAVILGIWTDLALLGIAALMFVYNITMHPFWKEEGMQQQLEMSMFMKNLSIAGGAIALFGFISNGYDAMQLVGPIFDLSN